MAETQQFIHHCRTSITSTLNDIPRKHNIERRRRSLVLSDERRLERTNMDSSREQSAGDREAVSEFSESSTVRLTRKPPLCRRSNLFSLR